MICRPSTIDSQHTSRHPTEYHNPSCQNRLLRKECPSDRGCLAAPRTPPAYNEYNKIENLVKIIRKGFPGKNREILLTYSLSNVRAIGIKITEGLNPTRSIYLCLKDERKIPLTPVQEPTSISILEEEAASLAKFLNLKLENL